MMKAVKLRWIKLDNHYFCCSEIYIYPCFFRYQVTKKQSKLCRRNPTNDRHRPRRRRRPSRPRTVCRPRSPLRRWLRLRRRATTTPSRARLARRARTQASSVRPASRPCWLWPSWRAYAWRASWAACSRWFATRASFTSSIRGSTTAPPTTWSWTAGTTFWTGSTSAPGTRWVVSSAAPSTRASWSPRAAFTGSCTAWTFLFISERFACSWHRFSAAWLLSLLICSRKSCGPKVLACLLLHSSPSVSSYMA